jgi:acyl CoA:acetate/3-ketoacid CoA transferase alpha subunit
MTKIQASAAQALHDLMADGLTIAVGGFGLSGIPADLIDAVRESGAKDLTIVSNNMGVDGKGLGVLIEAGQVRKVIASYVGENSTWPGSLRSSSRRKAHSPSVSALAEPAFRRSTREREWGPWLPKASRWKSSTA